MMRTVILICFLLLNILSGSRGQLAKCQADASGPKEQRQMTVLEMINYWGYPAEAHTVTTEDGYILTMHRIPHGKNEQPDPTKKKYPVFLGHCLLCSSAIFSFGPPDNSIAYMLADAGYDVWMGNTRGNTWSHEHETLSSCSNCTEYWKFSFGTTGERDYSAEIDAILRWTGYDDLFFIGYSMGTTQYLVLLSQRPEYNNKIRAGFLMGPAAYMKEISSPIVDLAPIAWDLQEQLHEQGVDEFLSHRDIYSQLAHDWCDTEHPECMVMCGDIFAGLISISPDQLDYSMVSFYLDHLPAGTSTAVMVHYAANYLNGGDTFADYDYGSDDANIAHYGTPNPPKYDISKITTPTALYVGLNDALASPEDGQMIADTLGDALLEHHIVDNDHWSHTDFFAGKDAAELVYKPIMAHMDNMGGSTIPPPSSGAIRTAVGHVLVLFTCIVSLLTYS